MAEFGTTIEIVSKPSRYEYKTIPVNEGDEIENILNELGKQGWELVGMLFDRLLIFGRITEEDAASTP